MVPLLSATLPSKVGNKESTAKSLQLLGWVSLLLSLAPLTPKADSDAPDAVRRSPKEEQSPPSSLTTELHAFTRLSSPSCNPSSWFPIFQALRWEREPPSGMRCVLAKSIQNTPTWQLQSATMRMLLPMNSCCLTKEDSWARRLSLWRSLRMALAITRESPDMSAWPSSVAHTSRNAWKPLHVWSRVRNLESSSATSLRLFDL
mmetsp:Transcript_68351/g.153160  ORF Transcript_68351/g.153160 Transcript_68351/m.153160 type:complete len:203 (-) Transcript_68351:5-613(-)